MLILRKFTNIPTKNHGELQANRYTDLLENCFLLIFENQNIGRTANDLSKDLFRHEHQKHIIFYRIKNNHIFVVRIRHNSEDISNMGSS